MRTALKQCVILVIIVWASISKAHAGYFDLSFLTFSDSFNTTTSTTISRTMYDIGLGVFMGKSESWIWAFNYGGGNFTDETTVTHIYSLTDIGFKVGYFLTKQRNWFITFTYNLESKAQFNDGVSESELRGTSIKADIGHAFWTSESLALAAKIFYYAPTFKESVAGTVISPINYRRSLIYPSFTLLFSF